MSRPDRCPACDFEFPSPEKTHVYRVKVTLGSGAKRWLYSEPTTKTDALSNERDLRATGYEVETLTAEAAEKLKAIQEKGRRRK